LVEKREEEVFVRDFLLVQLRGQILGSLERFLHFLRELVDAHETTYKTTTGPQFGKCA
jgi:hypothetical protein